MSIIGTNDQSFFDSSIFNQESEDLDWGKCTPTLTYKKPKLTIDSFSTTKTSLVLKNDKIAAGDKLSLSTTGTDIINGVAGSIITTPASYNISSPIVFNTTSGVNSVTVLKNGNFLIAFQDTSNSNYGAFVIMSPTGVEIKSKTSFCTVPISLVDCCTLLNGNIVIAYKNATDTYMWFTIINEEGNIVKSITKYMVFDKSISALALSNGMFVISGSYSTSFYGRSEFFYANGLASTSGYFTRTAISIHSVSELLNGNLFYAFNDGTTNNGQFKITNKTLGNIKSETIFNTGTTPFVSCSTLQNGNVFLCYSKSTTSGCFQIISETGVVVKTETVFNAGNTANIYSSVLQSGNILIIYKNVSDGKIYFVIYNQDGILVKTSSLISTASGSIYLASSKTGIVSILNNNTLNIIDMSELKTVDISQFNLQSAPVSAYLNKDIKLSTSFENTNQTFLDDYTPIDFLDASTSSVKINSNLSNVVSVDSPIKMLIGSTYETVKASSVTQAIVAGTGKYSNPKTIYSSETAALFGTGNSVVLSNGNIFLMYANSTESKVMYSIIDTFGNIIKNDVFVYGTTNYSSYNSVDNMKLKLLSNGNILITSRYNYYSIIDTNCNVIVPLTYITRVNSERITDAEALPGGNFVLIWYEDTGESNYIIKLSYSIYSSTGVQVKALTNFHSGTYSEFGLYLAVNKLTNGNFVIAFGICTNYTSYSGVNYYAIYSPTGAAVKSSSSFGSGYCRDVKIALLTGGNFVISYTRETSTLSDYSYRVFNSAGTAVTAATVIASQRVKDAYALPNGNFIITTNSTSATYETYSSTGVLISSASHAANGINTINDIVVTPDGNIFKLGVATLKNGDKALVYSFLNHGNTYQTTIGFPVQSAIPTSIQLPSNAIVSTNPHESLSGDVITAKYAPIIKKARSLQFRIELGTGVEIISTNYSLFKVLP